jgi:hypothetical protein
VWHASAYRSRDGLGQVAARIRLPGAAGFR